jgi:hypothetical protein
MEAKQGHRQGVIRVLLLADHHRQLIYKQHLITLQDDSNRMMLDFLIERILEKGIPKTIIVRDKIIKGLLLKIMEQLKIDIQINQKLTVIDKYVEEFSRQINQ